MKADILRKSILQYAIQGKLVPQIPSEESAHILLEKIKKEKQELIKQGKLKKEKLLDEIIGDEIPFDIPENWVWIRLGEVCFLVDGLKVSNQGLPYLDVKYLRRQSDKKIINCGFLVEKDTKAILVDGENSGEIFNIFERGYLGSTLKTFEILESFNKTFLNFILLFYKDYFRDNKKGAAIPHLNRTLFKELIIGLPPFEEQKRIVAKIEELMTLVDKYELYETELEKLEIEFPERLKKSILQYAIQGKLVPQIQSEESAHILLEKIKKEKQELIKQGKLKKEKPLLEISEDEISLDIPESWKWTRLHSILDVRDGTHDSPKYIQKGYPFITSKNLCNGKISLDKIQYISEQDFMKFDIRSHVDNGDILFAMIGSIGNPVLIVKEYEFSIKNVALVKFHNLSIFNKYIYFFLLYEQENMKDKSSGGVQSFIALNFLRNYPTPLPPFEEQKRIVAKIEELFSFVDLLSKNKKAVGNKIIAQQSTDETKIIDFSKPKFNFNDFAIAARQTADVSSNTMEEVIKQVKEHYDNKD